MDVTFREEEVYFSLSSSLQGENGHMKEMTSSITPILELPTYSGQGEYEYGNSDKSSSGDQVQYVEGTQIETKIGRLDKPDLLRYARKKDNTLHSSTSNPDSIASGNPLLISTHDIPTEMPDLDLSIAIRKGVRYCTQYPISNFISYDSLSPSYRTFLSSLNSISIPRAEGSYL